MSYLKEVIRNMRKPLCEGRGIKVFPLSEAEQFSDRQIESLKRDYSKISKVDPQDPAYKKLTKFLDGLPQSQLKQLAGAKIKFVSPLARNRLTEEYEYSDEDHDCTVEDEGYCDICGAWMDPAGGIHARRELEPDPARMYESRVGSRLRSQFYIMNANRATGKNKNSIQDVIDFNMSDMEAGTIIVARLMKGYDWQRGQDKFQPIFLSGYGTGYDVEPGQRVTYTIDTGNGHRQMRDPLEIENIITVQNGEVADQGNGRGINDRRSLYVMK